MKKLLCIFFLSGFLFVYFLPKARKVSKVKAALLLRRKYDHEFEKVRHDLQETNRNVSTIIPTYIWDAKMITW